MALSTKAIKQKIKGVSNIGKITRTMEMVSVSKMKKSVSSAFVVKSFSEKAIDLLAHIEKSVLDNHIYFAQNNIEQEILVIVSSNKGLAGSYNTNLYKKLVGEISQKNINKDKTVSICIGKQAEKISRRLGIKIIASFINIADVPSYEEAREISSIFIDKFKSKEIGRVKVLYTEYFKAMHYQPKILNILPISKESRFKIDEIHQNSHYKETIFEPNIYSVIEKIVPRLISGNMLSILADSSASEHSSRMFAMKSASDNAKEMKRILTISYNKARQDAVTAELAEIAAGSSI